MYKVPFPSLKTVKTFLLESTPANAEDDVLVKEEVLTELPVGYWAMLTGSGVPLVEPCTVKTSTDGVPAIPALAKDICEPVASKIWAWAFNAEGVVCVAVTVPPPPKVVTCAPEASTI